jgi:Tfp pilus assembly protein PilW
MKQDRFLLGILIGIALLVVAALVVFFTRQQDVAYRTGQAPEDVVHNYALALMNKDFEQAYGYLADLQDKPTFEESARLLPSAV